MAWIGFPNLKITVSDESIESWRTWIEEILIAWKNGLEFEKSVALDLLVPDLKTTLLKLEFAGLGIFRLEQQKQAVRNSSNGYYTA